MIAEALEKLIVGQDLDSDEMTQIMDAIMGGELTPAQIGGFLMALRIKGETVDEIAAAALSMRRHAGRIDAGPPPVVDTCGTGGDRSGTFNISTTAAFIAAGAGVKIAKHGNRSVSSQCGSADVLKALGVNIDAPTDVVQRCLQEVGIAFLFASVWHGAMKHAIGPRRELGVRTIFNMLGPLTNPAGASAQLIGVFAPELTETFAHVLQSMGTGRAMVVHGHDHLDEITGTDLTRVSELKNGQITNYDLDPRPLIGEFCKSEDIQGGTVEENAGIVRDILGGEDSPRANVAVLNAAAAIYVAGKGATMAEAVPLARASVSSGSAHNALFALIESSNK